MIPFMVPPRGARPFEAPAILGFLRAAGRLKSTQRRGWLDAGVERPESVAEHSFRTAIIAMVLADMEGLAADRAMRMALLHDLAEAETGDLTPEQKRSRGPAHEREADEAMERLISRLPEHLADRYRQLWAEYRGASTPEAAAAHQADRIEMMLQALEYEEAGADPSKLDRFWAGTVEGDLPLRLVKAMVGMRGGGGAERRA